ncbi:MAG: HD family hydrolase [Polyangiaceae bacterium]
MASVADRIIDTVIHLDTLSELPRTGWLLRGVRPCESIADHCFGVALLAMMLADELRSEGQSVNVEAVLRMAVLHDAPEARTGDVPMPSKTAEAARALDQLEDRLAQELLPPELVGYWREAEAGETLEARIVRAADKLQMMIKVMCYERTHRGDLHEFWENEKNFRHMDLPLARRLFERICERSGRRAPWVEA